MGNADNADKDKKPAPQDDEAKKGGESETIVDEMLRKSLDRLEGVVSSSPEGRRKVLLAKALNDTIVPAEQDELRALMAGEIPGAQGGPVEAVRKAMKDDDAGAALAKSQAFNASAFLEALHSNIHKSLAALGETIQKSERQGESRDIVMAKALFDFGEAIVELAKLQKGMGDKLEAVLKQPQRPRSAGNAAGQMQVRERGMGQAPGVGGGDGGGQPQVASLSKSEGFAVLEALLEKADKAKDDDAVTRYVLAISQYEQTNSLPPSVEQEVKMLGRKMFGQPAVH